MQIKEYNRSEAVNYAHKWAFDRNPKYYNFDSVGGDCTSFISQCIYAGSNTMNYSKYGWYYNSGYDKSPSWSGVEFLHNFIINNKSIGPFGKIVIANEAKIGDFIQLSFDGIKFSHSLLIVATKNTNNFDNILVASHTFDTDNKKISLYTFQKIRFINIIGVRF